MTQRYNPKDNVTLTMSVLEYAELVATLQRAEDAAAVAKTNEFDFRMQRIRLERKFRDSKPPTAPEDIGTADTQFLNLEDIMDMVRRSQR